jgi:hypothetical protein
MKVAVRFVPAYWPRFSSAVRSHGWQAGRQAGRQVQRFQVLNRRGSWSSRGCRAPANGILSLSSRIIQGPLKPVLILVPSTGDLQPPPSEHRRVRADRWGYAFSQLWQPLFSVTHLRTEPMNSKHTQRIIKHVSSFSLRFIVIRKAAVFEAPCHRAAAARPIFRYEA